MIRSTLSFYCNEHSYSRDISITYIIIAMKAKANLVIFVFIVYSSAFIANFEQILCIVSVSVIFEQILHMAAS